MATCVLGLVFMVCLVFGAGSALAAATGGNGDDLDWAEVLGGAGIGAGVGGLAGAGATLLAANQTRKTEREARREITELQRKERLAADVRALASEAAALGRQIAAYVDVAGRQDDERRRAMDAVRSGIAEVGWRQGLIVDDRLRSLASKYATGAIRVINSDPSEAQGRAQEAGKVLNDLMGRAGELYRELSAEDTSDNRRAAVG